MVRIAYLSQNRIHVRDADGTERVIESQYGEKVRARSNQIEKRNAWKQKGRGAQFAGGGMLWADNEEAASMLLITGLARGRCDDELLYSMRADAVSGVFGVDLKTGDEQRILHDADRMIEDVSVSPEGVIACSTRNKDGSASIALIARDGSQLALVTDGDSVDRSPYWIRNSPRQLVFQSQGVARDEVGQFRALGHATIAMLDAEGGNLEVMVDDADHEHTAPRLCEDGTLLCIRMPVHRAVARIHPLRAALDVLLFPFRVLWALARYLDFFTMRYTGKPLINAGDTRQKTQDLKKMIARGHLMEAKDAANRAAEREEAQDDISSIPQSWELVKRKADGSVERVARGVAAFDVTPDGGVVYANGREIVFVNASGKSERLCDATFVERVVAL